MICNTYLKMEDRERSIFLTKLIHAVQHSEYYLKKGWELIEEAEKDGTLDTLKIGVEIYQEKNLTYE